MTKQPTLKINGMPTQPKISEKMSNNPKGSQFKASCYTGKTKVNKV